MRHKRVLVSIVVGALLVGGTSFAQQGGAGSPMPQTPPHGGQGGMCPMMGSGSCPMMGGGMHGSMHGGGMMGGGMMGGQMMGDNPKALQMRGEMMKAMGDVMIKHGQMMEKAAKP
jgi:hypothetical protein